ncbi:ketopantoate reductase family protein [Altericroceibacterium endophyticum]|uniref:2-dehydropantoate 2-reductase n=1 Tax=Altericroceibacterium endophyticum TaxID=1808508 RepID=A0A6I4T777_9SPHN|nr:2-dehydropantoate 2-reductase [Altericroceibacterium endophyticum]MXO66796.1 2-dehydropantoate 2-reductase [Altericroceibacterium endophyticum]
MKIAIVGAGAMGCLYAAAFHRAKNTVSLIDVNREHIDAINTNGLLLETRRGKENLPLPAMQPQDAEETVDLIVLFTKTFHTDSALGGVKAIIGPQTHVLTLQNGLGNDDAVAAHVPQANVLVGVSTLPSDLVGPGSVRSFGEGGSKLYPAFDSGDAGFAGQVADALSEGGLPAELDPQIHAAIWSKAIFNATMNPLCALTRRTPGFLGSHAESRAMITLAVEEGAAVAQGCGIKLDVQSIHDLTELSMRDHADHEPSMLQDLHAGRRTEVDSIAGAIVTAGEARGIAAPTLATLWRLIKLEEAKLV